MAIVTDNFQRGQETPLSGGGNWGTNGVDPGLQLLTAGQVVGPATASTWGRSRWTGVSIGSVDQWVQATVLSTPERFGLIVRMSSTANTGYEFVCTPGGPVSQIIKRVSGSGTVLASVATAVVTNDVIELRIKGSNITVLRNGQTFLTASDSVIPNGDVGLEVYRDASQVSAALGYFSAGPTGLPGVPTILGPVYNGETIINGLGSATLIVEVYKGGNLAGSAQVDADGKWSYTFGSALATNDVLKARQKASDGTVGFYSANLTVQTIVLAPPAILGGLYSGNKDIVGFARPGVTVEVFKNGQSQGSISADGFGVFRYVMGSSLVTDDVYTAKQTVAGQQSSASPSEKVLAAPANTDTYKTNIFDALTTFDFARLDPDTDDIRRTIASVLTQAAILGSSTHEIKNAMAGVFYQYAARIAVRQG